MNLADAYLIDDGTMDTVIRCGGQEFRFSQDLAAEFRDSSGYLDLEEFIEHVQDEILEELEDFEED